MSEEKKEKGFSTFATVALLTLAGIAGNYFSLPFVFGSSIFFGSIAVMAVVILYGPAWGTLSAAIAGGLPILY